MTGHIAPKSHTVARSDRSPTVSIRDVARAAGVSHQTVSRVINESPKVSRTTRLAVLEAIDQLGFRPNRAARALAGGPVQSVTVLGSNTSLYGFAAPLEGVEEASRDVGFGMGFRALEELGPRDMREAVERAIEPASALIVIAFDRPGVMALEFVPPEVPMVAMIQAPTGDDVPVRPSVWIDEFSAAQDATVYLLGLGHKTVHHVAIPSWSGATRRMQGWRAALDEAGVRAPEVVGGGWTSEQGYELGCELAKDPSVTAILAGNDELALGVIRAMREVGHSVPADVSVIGFDDVPYARYLSPSLTTVRQDFKSLGKVAFAKLLELASSSRTLPSLPSPQARLVIRESAGPPSVRRSGSATGLRPRAARVPAAQTPPGEAPEAHTVPKRGTDSFDNGEEQ